MGYPGSLWPADNGRKAPMGTYLRIVALLGSDQRGVTALEYGLIAAVIVLACAAAFTSLGSATNTVLVGAAVNAYPTTP